MEDFSVDFKSEGVLTPLVSRLQACSTNFGALGLMPGVPEVAETEQVFPGSLLPIPRGAQPPSFQTVSVR